jgi:hypothetical protein
VARLTRWAARYRALDDARRPGDGDPALVRLLSLANSWHRAETRVFPDLGPPAVRALIRPSRRAIPIIGFPPPTVKDNVTTRASRNPGSP